MHKQKHGQEQETIRQTEERLDIAIELTEILCNITIRCNNCSNQFQEAILNYNCNYRHDGQGDWFAVGVGDSQIS